MSATITTALGEATELLSRMAGALHLLLDSVDDSTFAALCLLTIKQHLYEVCD